MYAITSGGLISVQHGKHRSVEDYVEIDEVWWTERGDVLLMVTVMGSEIPINGDHTDV
jgi:hypothetical protein